MITKFLPNSLLLFSALLLVMIPACGDSRPTGPGEEVVMSRETGIKGVPGSVIPYAEGTDITFANLKFNEKHFTLDYHNRGGHSFTLVLLLKGTKNLVFFYLDPGKRFILNSNGKVGLNLEGYKQKDVANRKGSFDIFIPAGIYGIYELHGQELDCFVFAVKGGVNPRSVLPGEQTDSRAFQALSNVLSIEVSY